MIEKYFGDRKIFAIRYIPGYSCESKKHYYAHCHLVLGGQIIGDKEEICYLNTWRYKIEILKERIKNNFNALIQEEFKNKADEELFELICKANQEVDEYKVEFAHLPVLHSKVWSDCHISIDETTDAFLITMTEIDGKIKFLWKGLREPCPIEKIGKLYSVIADRQFVIETMEECLQTLDKEYLTYPIK